MKRLTAVATGILATLMVAASVSAAPPTSGTTELLQAPTSGATVNVEASITSIIPVVPYEYAIQNECAFPGKKGSSYQRDDIVYWTYHDNQVPFTIMPIYLNQPVPVGSKCKVFLVRNNVVVKGSTTIYYVE